MINTISTALNGLFSASQKVNQSAQNIASIGTEGNDGSNLPQDIIDIKFAETQYKANLAVIKAADELTEELLKTFDEKV
jgi:flagellar basal body rod protein FlgC